MHCPVTPLAPPLNTSLVTGAAHAVTASDPPPDAVSLVLALSLLVPTTVNAVVPPGVVGQVVPIVRVEVCGLGVEPVHEIGLGAKPTVVPAGNAVETVRVTAIESLPEPRVTDTV
jgi:hypothetical protein